MFLCRQSKSVCQNNTHETKKIIRMYNEQFFEFDSSLLLQLEAQEK